MMFGGGFISHMITSIKNNEALRKRKSYFRNKQDYIFAVGDKKNILKEATKEELQSIKNKIIADRKKEAQKVILALIITVFITAFIVIGLILAIKRFLNLL